MDSGSSMLSPATRKISKKQAFRNDQYETQDTACSDILVADRCGLLKHNKRMTYLVNVWARSLKEVRHGAEGPTTCSLENNVKKAELRVSTNVVEHSRSFYLFGHFSISYSTLGNQQQRKISGSKETKYLSLN